VGLLQAAKVALSFLEGLQKEQAIGDEMRMSAFERKLEVLGEAARRVSPEFRRCIRMFPGVV
jgi:uncharacterized protein with HEPN domain